MRISCVVKGENTFYVRQHVLFRIQSKNLYIVYIMSIADHIYKLFLLIQARQMVQRHNALAWPLRAL